MLLPKKKIVRNGISGITKISIYRQTNSFMACDQILCFHLSSLYFWGILTVVWFRPNVPDWCDRNPPGYDMALENLPHTLFQVLKIV